MKKLVVALAAIMLTACSLEMQAYDIKMSERFCLDKGGVHTIHKVGGAVTATCYDGTVARVDIRGRQ